MQEYSVGGYPIARSRFRLPNPPTSREHPLESSIAHYATGVYQKDANGKSVLVGIKDEECRKRRHGMMTGRSKLNTATASSKTQRFYQTNGDVDAALDAPSVRPTALVDNPTCQPDSVAWQGARGLRRAKRAMRSR